MVSAPLVVNGQWRVEMQTLDFVREVLQTGGEKWFLYVHDWGTGFQYLIFPSKADAESWLQQQKEN